MIILLYLPDERVLLSSNCRISTNIIRSPSDDEISDITLLSIRLATFMKEEHEAMVS